MSIREAEPRIAPGASPWDSAQGVAMGAVSGPGASPVRRARRSAPDLLLSGLAAALLTAGIFSLLGPIIVGPWIVTSIVVIVIVFGAGYLLRRLHVPLAVVPLVQMVLLIGVLTLFFAQATALFGVVPTDRTVELLQWLMPRAVNDIVFGIAPMVASEALTFALVAAAGLLAIVLDVLVVSARLPILGGVAVLIVSLIPPLIVPGPVNLNALIPIVVLMFLATRRVTALAERRLSPQAERGGPATSAAVMLVAALVVGGAVAPLIEGPRSQIIPGFGPAMSISPSLSLGDDLRQPRETDVLTISSDRTTPAYLRISTLNTFNGKTWIASPDTAAGSLGTLASTPTVDVAPDMRVTEYTSAIIVKNLALDWLPLPYPAVKVSGLTGEWQAGGDTRTARAADEETTAGNQTYTVLSREVRPSAEQIRAAQTGAARYPDLAILPAETPAVVSELATSVVAEATNDYDRLVALQTWFRSSEFEYSLDAPVEDGFDGDSMEAIDRFLEVRAGYCAHFAAAFTLMARSLDMPARIVVGFLPGESTDDVDDDNQRIFKVTSSQLHAWPEVYFEGIGWVPFEPTQSLGTPTSFAASQPADAGGTEVGATVAPTEAPTVPDETVAPSVAPTSEASSGTKAAPFPWVPLLVVIVVIALVLLIPAAARAVVRSSRTSAIREGSAVAAWREVVATAADYGITPSATTSARETGVQLVSRGAPSSAITALVTAIERASYGSGHTWDADNGAAMAAAVGEVRAGLRSQTDTARRIIAVLFPRSLVSIPLLNIASRGDRAASRRDDQLVGVFGATMAGARTRGRGLRNPTDTDATR